MLDELPHEIISPPGGIFDAFIAEVVTSMVDSGSPGKPGAVTDFRAIAAKYGLRISELKHGVVSAALAFGHKQPVDQTHISGRPKSKLIDPARISMNRSP